MPEYVYALHEFIPENDDELPFRLGERIEVIEKDDMYGDGWWQGRNTGGKTGLFPQSYTSTNLPSGLASGESSSSVDATSNLKTPNAPAILLNGEETNGHSDEVMQATMTDVQQAIEQLGRRGRTTSDAEDSQSFSFASSGGGVETENETDTEFELSDGDGADKGAHNHKRTRQKLAQKARQALADAERLEMIGMARTSSNRSYAPPIAVELSDESEEEDEHEHLPRTSGFARRHSYIPEEDEDGTESPPNNALHPAHMDDKAITDHGSEYSANLSMSEPDPSELQAVTATRATFPADAQHKHPVSAHKPSNSISLAQAAAVPMPQSPLPSKRTSAPFVEALPSPLGQHESMASRQERSSTASTTSTSAPMSASALMAESSTSTAVATALPSEKKDKTHPSEWTMEEVIEWLQSKGFDQDVCDKFTEQEITGDVLLELDVNLLKTEIGIMAYGKRARIANAITDLRRPPSIVYSDHPDQPSPSSNNVLTGQSPLLYDSPQSYGTAFGHSRNTSQPQSHHSYPGSFSVQSSVNGLTLLSPESAAGDFPSPVASTLVESELAGGSTGTITKSRPSQLSLSPSDGALNARAVAGIPEENDEDRAAMSDNETGRSSSMRRRIFGRSQDSTGSAPSPRHSAKDSISPTSMVHDQKESEKDEKEKKDAAVTRHGRAKKSVDVGKSSDRLSLFGGSFGGTLGKSRKPPPKYSGDDVHTLSEKNSSFHLPRLYSTGGRKSNGRPSTSSGMSKSQSTPAKEIKDTDIKEGEPRLLRKRTSSYPGPTTSPTLPHDEKNVTSPLKSGQSILQQIGAPDHSGWMRKRGDRYNSWKMRYFVLKGPHLYCLKSESQAQTKIKGYINIIGYRVTVDENVNPGKYNFRIEHEQDKMHYFSSDDKSVIREWMKAIMKATIARDYTQPVISSCNIPTIPLMVAQAMNPAPRPPSPTAREATQKALRRENPNQLSSRDARVLMGLPSNSEGAQDRNRLESFFSTQSADPIPSPTAPPPRPSRRKNSAVSVTLTPVDESLIEWANSHLPNSLQIMDTSGSLCGGLELFRIAESIKGRVSSPPVPDSAFPVDANDERLEGLFKLFDFLLDNDVKMGSVSINDVRLGQRDKIVQMLKALKAWEEKRRALAQSIGNGGGVAGGFMAPSGSGSPWTVM